uniref:TIAM2 n=1 Tax=Gadus morhua TaxID=8049 RepID=A0A8C4ZW14_GADMO
MGNSESQYSIQGPKGTSFFFPVKQKPYSLKFPSSKEDDLSPHTWWKNAPRGSGFKARSLGRGCLSPARSRPPYSSGHYDYISQGAKGSPLREPPQWCGAPGLGAPGRRAPGGYRDNPYGAEFNGHAAGDGCDGLEEQSSPRVVIKKDGSLRVEFTNTPGSPLVVEEVGGPVQLLKFSPNVDAAAAAPGPPGSRGGPPPGPASSMARTSKGSSLSSDGSWYDSPWGPSAELCAEQEPPCSASRTLILSPGHESLDEHESSPMSVPELYRDPTMAATFPATVEPACLYREHSLSHKPYRASFASALDVPERLEARQYSSYTLPCRRPKAGPEFGFQKKDSIKNRIRRLSDWTGSLARKKKSQEQRHKAPSDAFDSGVDGLTADTSSPSQVSSLPWFPGASAASRAQSQGALHQASGDAVRQNIYENFMRELGETGGEEEEEEEERSSSESPEGSLEQLDLLFEKEQGVVRRAGWLSFKPLLTLHKDRKLELVSRRRWKQYWVTLKGCTLLFYETYGKGSPEQEGSPRYALLAEDSVVQAVPEHPKKENVFCLSNSYGDVYLFQASNQTDLENWVTAVHSASASLVAKRQGKEDTVRLLRGQVRGLLQKVDMDGKMKKMAELQLTVVADPKNRKAIENQVSQWEQNLERFNMDLFRMRCYLASLQGGELPNPKSLLATAGRPSKAALGRLGIFSVSSFHALICSRDEATLRRRRRRSSVTLASRQRKRGLFSSLKGLDNLTLRGRDKRPSVSQVRTWKCTHTHPGRLDVLTNIYSMSPPEGGVWESSSGSAGSEALAHVRTPDGLTLQLPIRADLTAAQLLASACKVSNAPQTTRKHLRMYLKTAWCCAPPVSLQMCDHLEVVPLNVFNLHMRRPSGTGDFGFAVTGHIDAQKNSRIFVNEVLPDGLAIDKGLRPGDEILVLNGRCVSGLDLVLIQTLFAEQQLSLSLRRDVLPTQPPAPPHDASSPPRPKLEVPTPHHHQRAKSISGLLWGFISIRFSVDTVCTLYQSFQDGPVSGAKGAAAASNQGSRSGPGAEAAPAATLLRPCQRHMSPTERLCKVIQELVDTEKSYVKDLACLFDIYLKPLQDETFLTLDEMESLFGSLPEMLDFQRVFLQTLEEKIASSPDFSTLETPAQFKRLLFSLGASFLYYADHFKLYSGFCANHIKVQKVLERVKTDRAFKEFLDARNPTKQHSSTLESYLIKPVQRVLKYPLLLRELVSLTDVESEEHYHLNEALKAMEKVASHINDMQKLYEDYGAVFDQLVAEQTGHNKEVTEISMGEFLMHSPAVWLNPHPSLGRMRKDPEMTVFVFKKAVILVYREHYKLKKKMTTSRSSTSQGDTDPFKFRWLIPLSALQVRLGNTAGAGTETSCIWELIHTRSEVEGRPETIFQLCSSVPEYKANVVKVMRSILRENVRRGTKGDAAPDRGCRERLAPLRGTLPSSARIGEADRPPPTTSQSSSAPGSSGTAPPGTSTDPRLSPAQESWSQDSGCHSQPSSSSVKESDALSDEDADAGFGGSGDKRRESAGALEARFLQLQLSEEAPAPRVQPEGAEVNTPESQHRAPHAHYSPLKRKPSGGLRRSPGAPGSLKGRSRSLDSQADTAAAVAATVMDINSLLEREFSVQSLTSVVNEDCFYDLADGRAVDSGNDTPSP